MHTELQEHGETLQLFQNAEAADWEGLVAQERLQLTAEFFDHVENLIHAAHQNDAQREGIDTISPSEAHVAHHMYISTYAHTAKAGT